MKKLSLLLTLFFAVTVVVNAQEFKKFKVGVGLGYASASGEGASGGVLFYLEPAYRLSDQIQVGLRMESALIARGFDGSEDGGLDLDIAAIGSYTLNGQYYFKDAGFRPFAGLGFGLYSLAAVKLDGDGDGELAESESKFGVYPRLGFDAGHFQFSIDYNIIPKTEVSYTVDFGGGDTETVEYAFKNSYIGFRFGVSIGGGKK